MSRRKTYGFTREKAEHISKNTEEAYLRLYEKVSISKEQLKDLGEQSLKAYVETSPDDFNKEDFLDLTDDKEMMNDYYILTDSEVIELRNDFKQAMEKLRVLLDEDVWYSVPSGLSREERRKWISDIGSKLLTESDKGEIVVKE